jgi:hypothetical protein
VRGAWRTRGFCAETIKVFVKFAMLGVTTRIRTKFVLELA